MGADVLDNARRERSRGQGSGEARPVGQGGGKGCLLPAEGARDPTDSKALSRVVFPSPGEGRPGSWCPPAWVKGAGGEDGCPGALLQSNMESPGKHLAWIRHSRLPPRLRTWAPEPSAAPRWGARGGMDPASCLQGPLSRTKPSRSLPRGAGLYPGHRGMLPSRFTRSPACARGPWDGSWSELGPLPAPS